MFKIIIRNNGRNTQAIADNQLDAQTLFHALTKSFLIVELWRGAELVRRYDNT